ncbi:MAG: glycosyltransferase family 9 protein [Bacteroidota bacterium]
MNQQSFSRILIIQTAYIGDVILMTPLIEAASAAFPKAQIDVLVNQGNASLLVNHPKINELLLWDKKEQKNRNLMRLLRTVRTNSYDVVFNCHRYTSSGILTILSRASYKVGFNSNSLARWYDLRVPHEMKAGKHEVDRNLALLEALVPNLNTTDLERRPRLYPSQNDEEAVTIYQNEPYLCLAPTSVWYTKQFPASRWVQLLDILKFEGKVYLLGGHNDMVACDEVRVASKRENVINLAGKLSLLQSAVLMKRAVLNYVNDSAPLHLASAMNAPVCAIFCSTVPSFGFTPLSDFSEIVEISKSLSCRPCGIHGYKACPEKHFRCANDIDLAKLVEAFKKAIALNDAV